MYRCSCKCIYSTCLTVPPHECECVNKHLNEFDNVFEFDHSRVFLCVSLCVFYGFICLCSYMWLSTCVIVTIYLSMCAFDFVCVCDFSFIDACSICLYAYSWIIIYVLYILYTYICLRSYMCMFSYAYICLCSRAFCVFMRVYRMQLRYFNIHDEIYRKSFTRGRNFSCWRH